MCQCSVRKYKKGFLFRFWNEQALFIPVHDSPSVAQCPSDQCPVVCFLPRPGDPCLGGLASSPARTGHGPGRSLLSPLLTSQHTHHHTPKDTKKNSKMCPHDKWEGKSAAVNQRELGHHICPSVGCSVVRRPVPHHNTQISDVQSQGRDWPMSGPTHGAVIARVPGTRHRQSRPQLSCHACHKVRVSSHLSHLSQLPRYTPLTCQHIRLITPGVTPGGQTRPRHSADTRAAPHWPVPSPRVTRITIRSQGRSPWGS